VVVGSFLREKANKTTWGQKKGLNRKIIIMNEGRNQGIICVGLNWKERLPLSDSDYYIYDY